VTSTLPRRPDSDADPIGRRRGRLTWWLVGASIVVVLILATWVVAFSSLLGAKTITVKGVQVLSADQVRAAAAIAPGSPLIRLDQGAVTRRVETLPDVASAEIRLRYPSTVIITVTERVAIGYVVSGSGYALVDHDGRQFRPAASPPPALPRFSLPSGAQAVPVGAAMASVAAALSGTPVLAQLLSIQATQPDAITLALRDGRTVLWGGPQRSGDKAKVLPALLARPGHSFDVSDPDLVVAH
jgi:cell division protein FtsQ